MPWFYIIFFLSLTFNKLSGASHENKLPSTIVVGTVYCDTCFQQDISKNSHFISGATVAVECKDNNSRPSFRKEVKTDEHGEFKVHLPFSVSKHVKKIKRCSVKLLSSSEPYCAVASTATSSTLHLKSREQGTHIFSAGFFTFKPQNQPNLCNQKPSIQNSRKLNAPKTSIPAVPAIDNPTFPSPLIDPTTPDLPPLNQNQFPPLPLLPKLPPLPELPSLPPLPGLPNLPPLPGKITERKTTESAKSAKLDQKVVQPEANDLFPPNPFQPPPSLFPPNPFQPPPSLFPPNPFQPPPSLFPPNPFQPPPSPLIPLPPLPFPPIPGLTPPSPPPPAFPFPFPPFPFTPLPFPFPPPPRIPRFPPTSSSSSQKPSP